MVVKQAFMISNTIKVTMTLKIHTIPSMFQETRWMEITCSPTSVDIVLDSLISASLTKLTHWYHVTPTLQHVEIAFWDSGAYFSFELKRSALNQHGFSKNSQSLKVGYEKADGGNSPVLIMGAEQDQGGRGFLRVGETIVDMANSSSHFTHSFD